MSTSDLSSDPNASTFSLPSNLNDLESSPYNLLPYPSNFDEDGDESSRAESFTNLLIDISNENKKLKRFKNTKEVNTLWFIEGGENIEEKFALFEESAGRVRVQALYTLVR